MKPKLLGKIVCALLRRHVWRKAHKGEAMHSKYCRRCGLQRVVSTRGVKT